MTSKFRRFVIGACYLCGGLTLLIAALLYTSQTDWFKSKIREKIVAAVEEVSGGRIEIGSFDYNWRTLTADFQNFVVHGTEPHSTQPLFHADRVRVGLRIISVLKRSVDVASVVVSRPKFHLVVGPDGTTNIPVPRLRPMSLAQGVQALLDFKVRHFEFDDGLFEADVQSLPLSFSGENASLLLTYVSQAHRYNVSFSSYDLRVHSDRLRSFSGKLQANAQLERDRLSIQRVVFESRNSTVRASGALQHFAHPLIDLRLSADTDASDLAALTNFGDLRHGRLTLEGTGHYDQNTSFAFRGRLVGRDLAYRIRAFDLKKANLEAELLIRPQDVEVPHFVVGALGANLSGHMFLKRDRDLQMDGSLSGLNVRSAAALVSGRDFPWSGVARGPIRVRAVMDRNWRAFTVQGNLAIASAPGGVPIAGDIDASYRADSGVVEFARSSLQLPYTRVSFSGVLGKNLDVDVDSTNLDDLIPVFQLTHAGTRTNALPTVLRNGTARFDGKVIGSLRTPQLNGNLALSNFKLEGQTWDQVRSRVVADSNKIAFSSLILDGGRLNASADGSVSLEGWIPNRDSAFQLRGAVRGADLANLVHLVPGLKLQSVGGIGSGSFDLRGTFLNPSGTAQLSVANLDAYGERLNQLELTAAIAGEKIQITRGHLQAGPAELSFSGTYQRSANSWREGQLEAKVDSNGFPLASLAPVHDYEPGLNAQSEIHAHGSARVRADRIEPLSVDGTTALRNVTVRNVPYGSINFKAGTRGQSLTMSFEGNLRGSGVTGTAQVQLTSGNPTTGQMHVDSIQLSTVAALIHPREPKLPFEGVLQGGLTFEGPLQQLNKMHGTISIETLQLTPNVPASTDLTFRNVSPVVFQYGNGVANVSTFRMRGKGTEVTLSGTVPLVQQRPIQAQVTGSVDLGLFQVFNPSVRVSGESLVAVSVGGSMMSPTLNGTVEVKNGTVFTSDFPNGLTAVNGTLRFDHHRATIERLTARTGGGQLSMGGFMTFGNGGPLVYRLEAKTENARVRYGGSVSITATSQLRLTGTNQNSILSGTATISRVIFNPNTDVGNLLTSAGAPAASLTNDKDFLTGLQLDIHVESAPNLELNTELSRDVEAEIDLRLRGTPERPILLGSITANQGDIKAFGTKYTINRGEVTFVNAVKIEPVLDLDLQTQARGITVDITVSGTPGKLNINYRSDPPLQPREIIALLTVGRAPNLTSNVPDVSITNDVSALQSGANTVLGQAISPASNRLSKLFGITNIKIDPMVQGITNAPQARLTVEQQISRQITVTYITNLSQTSEQIFRLEWAFSTQYSLVALRDDNGEFGIDIQYRKRFK